MFVDCIIRSFVIGSSICILLITFSWRLCYLQICFCRCFEIRQNDANNIYFFKDQTSIIRISVGVIVKGSNVHVMSDDLLVLSTWYTYSVGGSLTCVHAIGKRIYVRKYLENVRGNVIVLWVLTIYIYWYIFIDTPMTWVTSLDDTITWIDEKVNWGFVIRSFSNNYHLPCRRKGI